MFHIAAICVNLKIIQSTLFLACNVYAAVFAIFYKVVYGRQYKTTIMWSWCTILVWILVNRRALQHISKWHFGNGHVLCNLVIYHPPDCLTDNELMCHDSDSNHRVYVAAATTGIHSLNTN